MSWRIIIKAIITKDYAKESDAAAEAAEMERHLKMSKERFCKALDMRYIVKVEEVK